MFAVKEHLYNPRLSEFIRAGAVKKNHLIRNTESLWKAYFIENGAIAIVLKLRNKMYFIYL